MDSPKFSWYGSFRLFLNNGYLTSVYLDFFSHHPPLYYADSFLSGYLESPFPLPYGRMIGEYIATYRPTLNNATANFLADGYANIGYVGMFFSTIVLWLVLAVADSLAEWKDPIFTGALMIPLALAFSNVPVHTAMMSNGGFIILLLLTIAPNETQPHRSRTSDGSDPSYT